MRYIWPGNRAVYEIIIKKLDRARPTVYHRTQNGAKNIRFAGRVIKAIVPRLVIFKTKN